jgi:hypothetical protein
MIMITRVLLAAVLFYVVSNPATYKLVESLLGRFFKIAMNGSPTPAGLLVHTAVFAALFYLLAPMVSGLDAKEYRMLIDAKLADAKDRNENFDDVLMTPLRVVQPETVKDVEEIEAVAKGE